MVFHSFCLACIICRSTSNLFSCFYFRCISKHTLITQIEIRCHHPKGGTQYWHFLTVWSLKYWIVCIVMWCPPSSLVLMWGWMQWRDDFFFLVPTLPYAKYLPIRSIYAIKLVSFEQLLFTIAKMSVTPHTQDTEEAGLVGSPACLPCIIQCLRRKYHSCCKPWCPMSCPVHPSLPSFVGSMN